MSVILGAFLYIDIATSLRGRIQRGDFTGGKLPSERELLAEFGVQRATVRRALKRLENEGLIFRDTTRGTFVVDNLASGQENRYSADSDPAGIALIIGCASDTTAPGDIARGMAQAVREAGRFLIWFENAAKSGHAEANVPEPEELIACGIGACALWPDTLASPGRLRALRQAMPVVLLDRRVAGFESDFVGINDRAAGRMVTERLLSIGHRRIAFLAVEPHVVTVQSRMQGWRDGLQSAGITPLDRWVVTRPRDFTPADDGTLEALLSAPDAPTALFCTNDTVAAQAIRFLQTSGRRIGEDMAVTGFGNAFPTLLDALGLTTIAQPWERIGFEAGKILSERLAAQNSGASLAKSDRAPETDSEAFIETELAVDLIIRRSCGQGIFSSR